MECIVADAGQVSRQTDCDNLTAKVVPWRSIPTEVLHGSAALNGQLAAVGVKLPAQIFSADAVVGGAFARAGRATWGSRLQSSSAAMHRDRILFFMCCLLCVFIVTIQRPVACADGAPGTDTPGLNHYFHLFRC